VRDRQRAVRRIEGGIKLRPRDYTPEQLQKITRRYTAELIAKNFIGPGSTSPPPTTAPASGRWLDCRHLRRLPPGGSTTGRASREAPDARRYPRPARGDRTRRRVRAARGLPRSAHAEEDRLKGTLSGKKVAIQGFGNVGYHVAKILYEEDGCKIVAIGEYDGAAYNPNGLDIDKLGEWFQHKGTIKGFKGATKTLANGGTCSSSTATSSSPPRSRTRSPARTRPRSRRASSRRRPTADDDRRGEHPHKKDVLILSDIYLNSGGVTVSYFEWAKNISHMRYGLLQKRADAHQRAQIVAATEEIVRARFPDSIRRGLLKGVDEEDLVRSGLEETMATGYNEISDVMKKNKKVEDFRTAAFICAIEKVGRAYLELGVFP
jgi:glutamate dehydrogenase (NAD(P)+)